MRHHTKDKGDIGVTCVMADLVRHGIQVALPVSEHLPFDLIAIHPEGAMAKVSVKYRVMKPTGTVKVETRSSWNDRNGTHCNKHQPGDNDAVAIYCPDTDECYYLRASELSASGKSLRIRSPANNQLIRVTLAREFTDPGRMFAPVPDAEHVVNDLRPGQESNLQSAI